ncbi:hypothetical protein Tdes44962_MAKER08135 [Teratosphaeria destructans]|uniref:Uncharacterized protein n=1 Tax=Teratosphaeria destructans TaxID=418781 RepID=A0A9W7SXC1_9PEZI|nr:hypothetical protein Tdes44962_MAKER08135 [Teratosphaeria destructans]
MAIKLTKPEIAALIKEIPDDLREKTWGRHRRSTAEFLTGGLRYSYEMTADQKSRLTANCKLLGVHRLSPPSAQQLASLSGPFGADDLTGWEGADRVLMGKVLNWIALNVAPPEQWEGGGRWLQRGEVPPLIEGALARAGKKRGVSDKTVASSSREAVERVDGGLTEAAVRDATATWARRSVRFSKKPLADSDSETDDAKAHASPAPPSKPRRPSQSLSLQPQEPKSARPSQTPPPRQDFDFSELVVYLRAEHQLAPCDEGDQKKVLELGQSVADRQVRKAEKKVEIWGRRVEALMGRMKDKGMVSLSDDDGDE